MSGQPSDVTAHGLLDTSVVISLERVPPEQLPAEPAIASITLAELTAGPHATDEEDERARRQDRLQRVEALLAASPDDTTRNLVTELSVEPVPSGEDSLHRYAESVVLRQHEVWVARRLVTLKAKLQRTDPSAETDVYNRLFGELMVLEKQRRDLRERGLGNGS